ncbi:hypothetical protein JTB14_037062 [Gonioctena quinquepunctata]|nr:hypothetical protein JTB14_037062 [Gonioctena quinquepunctata]
MANWLKQVVDTGDSDVQDTAAEAQELRREIAKLKEERDIKKNDIMVQCDECKGFKKRTQNLKISKKNIWEAPQDHDVALPCNSNFKNVNGLVETAINKLGGKDGLKKQGKRKGEVAIMIHSLGFPETTKCEAYTRSIYYPITGDEGERVEVEDETLFQAMEKIKSHIVRQRKTALAVPELDGIGGIMFTRILEYIFADSEIQITMYGLEKNSKQPPKVVPNTTTRRGRLNSVNGNKGQTKKKQ